MARVHNRYRDGTPKSEYKQQVTELKVGNKRLKRALRKYGWHINCGCQAVLVKKKGKRYPKDCDCGFEQALKA